MSRDLPTGAGAKGLAPLLAELVERGGTDLHLEVPSRPAFRVDGRIVPSVHPRLLPGDVEALARAVLELAGDDRALRHVYDARVAFGVEGLGRFRACIARQRGSFGVVVQRVETCVPVLEELGVLGEVAEVLAEGWGLVLVGGERRRHAVSAAIIGAYSRDFPGHVVSIEQPLRYLHRNSRAAISQREVGIDCESRASAVAALASMDPDLVVLDDAHGPAELDPVMSLVEEGGMAVISLPVPAGEDIVRAFSRRLGPGPEGEAARRVSALLRAVVRVPRHGEAYVEPLGGDRRSQLRSGVIMPVLGVHSDPGFVG